MSFMEFLFCLWVRVVLWSRLESMFFLLNCINMYFTQSETSFLFPATYSWAFASICYRRSNLYISIYLLCMNLPSSISFPGRPRKMIHLSNLLSDFFPERTSFRPWSLNCYSDSSAHFWKKNVIKSILLPLESFSKCFSSYIWSSFQFIANLLCFVDFFFFPYMG